MPTLAVDGVRIYYELREVENPLGTVALLNGVMASASSWEFFADLFRRAGYCVLLHDFRGQLLSDKPPGTYTFARHARDLVALLSTLEIVHPHLIGTSYGGEVAMRLAIDFPELPKTISIIDSVSETDGVLDAIIDSWIDLAQAGEPKRFFFGIMPAIYSSRFISANRAMLVERASRMKDFPADYFAGQAALYRTFKDDVRMTDELPSIRCPALVVCGDEDLLKPPRFSRIIASKIAGSEYVIIPGAAHVVIFEKPAELATLLLGFLAKH